MQDAHISFVLDQSSSMGSLVDATIKSFNSFVKGQREVEGNAWLSLTLFDTEFDVRYVAWNVKDLPDMSTSGSNHYNPSGMTALYDAVAVSIKGAEKWKANNDWFDGKMIVVIQTDGQENSSREWTIDRLNDLIKAKRAEGWEFIFMGTGQAAWLEAKKFTSLDQNNFHAHAATMDSYTVASAAVGQTIARGRMGGSYNVDQTGAEAQIEPEKATS